MLRTHTRCDLLSKSVHCNVENNHKWRQTPGGYVVICFQNPFIAMSKTTPDPVAFP